MRLKWIMITVCLVLGTAVAFAHHATEGIVDDEIYTLIDEMVAGTPHADLVFDDMGSITFQDAETEGEEIVFTITFQSVKWFQYLVDKDLMLYLSMLSGEVKANLKFLYNGAVILTVTQIKDETSD